MPAFLDAIQPFLPEELANHIEALTQISGGNQTLEACIRFVLGAPAPDGGSHDAKSWAQGQQQALEILDSMLAPTEHKRRREADDSGQPQGAKRPKLSTQNGFLPASERGSPLFTIHSISVTSPIRKKVDVVISSSYITFENPSTKITEAEVPLSTLTRAFLLPTRGKQKAHWTIVLLPADTPDKRKAAANSVENQQVIFGIDAASPGSFQTTTYGTLSEPSVETSQKGTETLPALRKFLAHLPIPLFEPNTHVFRSTTSGGGPKGEGVPGIEAYLGAKQGTLWFMKEGILWGESKPCEFWPVEDLISKTEGLRVIGGTGRTCSVVLTRRSPLAEGEAQDEAEGVEAVFGIIDVREQDPISKWVRQHRHLFGDGAAESAAPAEDSRQPQTAGGKTTFAHMQFNSDDESDASFASSGGSHDGSSANSDTEADDRQDDGQESGAESGEDQDASGEDDEEELKPEHHPLLRPGAMPRMSRAAIDMVVNMVEDDLRSGGAESEEEDELAE